MQAARGTPLSGEQPQDHPVDRPRRLGLFVIVVVVAYAVDVVTKIIAVAELEGPPVKTVTVIPHVLDLTLVRNSGAAFGIATGFTAVLTAIAAGVCLVVVRMAGKLRDPIWAFALGLLLAGALGNLTDRLVRSPGPMRGHVVDFLALPNWPVFNFADCCVTVAAVLIAIQSFRGIALDGHRVNDDGDPDEPADDE
ncbi:signal peptidase II [Nocardioidaceae bacterium SCSIO 66511]|nr:signal peptidase II [Nocardioidaceae bacterium SCSIO 66511]